MASPQEAFRICPPILTPGVSIRVYFSSIKPVLNTQIHDIFTPNLMILFGSQSQEMDCVDNFLLWRIMNSREKFGCPWKEDLIRHHPISLSLCKRSHRLKEKIFFYENVSQRGEGSTRFHTWIFFFLQKTVRNSLSKNMGAGHRLMKLFSLVLCSLYKCKVDFNWKEKSCQC